MNYFILLHVERQTAIHGADVPPTPFGKQVAGTRKGVPIRPSSYCIIVFNSMIL